MNIFISPKILKDNNKSITYTLEKNWFDYAKKIGFNIVLITNPDDLTGYFKTFRPIGLIVSGGGNIYSKEKNKLNLMRDLNEIKYINFFLKKKLPILAICRGYQLFCYKNNIKINTLINHVTKNHPIKIIGNDKLINFTKLNTNSYHNFGVYNLNKNFLTIGKSKDNSIEIAKLKNHLMYLVMFHPERQNFDQKKIDFFFRNLFFNK